MNRPSTRIRSAGGARIAIRVVSLFCGMGNADAALYDAAEELGIEVHVVAAFDSWPKAVEVYNANLPPVAQVADVKSLQRSDLPPHDLVIGGPPCQPFSSAGKRKGHDDPRNCLPHFVRLAAVNEPNGPAWIMENVVARLINAPWSERLCAADYGDVTSRKRWFYSSYLLHVVKTPGARRIRDIRDHDEDRRVLCKRAGCKAGAHTHYDDALDTLDTLQAHSWHGHDIRGSGKLLEIITHRPRTNEQGVEPYATIAPNDGVFGSLTADAPRAYSGESVTIVVRTGDTGNDAREIRDDDMLPSLTAKSNNNCNMTNAALRLGLRGNSTAPTATAFDNDEVLGSLLANSCNGNRTSELVGYRNPSLLEMARAHSIPDAWDWCGATKTQRGQMIANSWPRGLGKAVCKAVLSALVAERSERAS